MKEKTQKNVQTAFVGEAKAYFRLLAYADKAAEEYHAKLYERAIFQSMKKDVNAYQVCQVCGYVTDKKAPKKCPVCGAPKEKFKTVAPEMVG
jgi:rubrerythrin